MSREPRLPGESPCHFMNGMDGWTNCTVHGWSGYKEQRSRVLVCPHVNDRTDEAADTSRVPLDVDGEVELMRAALHEQGIGCKPNVIHCRATHRGHANRLVSSIHAIRDLLGAVQWAEAEAALPRDRNGTDRARLVSDTTAQEEPS